MNERIKDIVHEGITIIFVDYSGLKPKEILDLIEEAKEHVLSKPKTDYAPTIVDVSDIYMDNDVKEALQQYELDLQYHFGKENMLKMPVAVIGVTGIKKALGNLLFRSLTLVDDMDQALNYVTKRLKELR